MLDSRAGAGHTKSCHQRPHGAPGRGQFQEEEYTPMNTTTTTTTLPHWDMTVIYPSLESPEFTAAAQALGDHLGELTAEFDRLQIDHRAPAPLDDATVAAFETITGRLNALVDEFTDVGTYISSFIATDSRNAAAQARNSEFQQQEVRLSQLITRFTAWIGS